MRTYGRGISNAFSPTYPDEGHKNMKNPSIIAAVICCLFVAANSGSAQSTNFILSCSPTVAAKQSCVAVADMNGDNKPDLICSSGIINGTSGALTVLTNDGAGVFITSATFAFSSPVFSVVAMDVNGDHKPDVACLMNNSVTVFTNNGAGILGSNSSISVGLVGNEVGPQSLATADVNGDGYSDLLLAPGSGTFTASIYTNNRSGKFGSYTNLTLASAAQSVAVGGLAWNGSTDVVCGGGLNLDPSLVEVFVNNGKGVLTSNFIFNSGENAMCVVPADFNSDGKTDLACYDIVTRTVEVFTNLGNATFFQYSNSVPAFFTNLSWIAAADLNQDKKVDLISADSVANTLTVFTNNGSGVFGSHDTVNVGQRPVFIVAADINGDGKPDLIAANQTDNTLTVLTNATQIPLPPLTIVATGNQSALFWPSNQWNYLLQTTTNLASTNWTTVTNGTPNICITVSNASPAAFYRLQPNPN
jgi:hypothetical protein